MHPKVADPAALLAELARADIDCIVIGGAAAALHGSMLGTLDVDVVRKVGPDATRRLLPLLANLDARFRFDLANRQLRPDHTHLDGRGALLFSTRLGPLDMLGQLNDGRDYQQLLPHTLEMPIGATRVRVLDLPTLIEVKRAVGRPKDLLAVAHLAALLRQSKDRAD